MNLTVIFPNISNKTIIKTLSKNLDDNDEIITFKQNPKTLVNDLNYYISNSKYDDILILNPKESSISKNIKMVENFRVEGYFCSNLTKLNKISPSSSIKFNKNCVRLPDQSNKIINLKQYITVLNQSVSEHFQPEKKTPSRIKLSYKPKILFVSDVKGWAWWIKSEFIKYYLSDEFNIDIISVVDDKKAKIDSSKYDLYLTFGWSYVHYLIKNNVPFHRRITGVTAHRPFNTIKEKLTKAKYIHANSMMLLDEIKKLTSNVFYVPNGVDTDLFYPIENKEERILSRDYINIGHVGKKAKLKCQDTIIEPCMKKLSKYGFKYIYHYNDYRNRIPHTEMPRLYNDMDLFIVASKEDGTPNGALEAMASGIPVISNKIGNMDTCIINGYNGYLVDKLNIDNYVDLIKNLDKEHIVEMGKNARQTILNNWTWEKKAENYRDMFHKILGNI